MMARRSAVKLSLSDYHSEVELMSPTINTSMLSQVVKMHQVAKDGRGRCFFKVASRLPLEKAAICKDGGNGKMKIFLVWQ
ncbi:hypothetical protein TKK_0012458 [Trichogramma kaykai]|uniref:Uncharacterized protein n=1 Tax=Trichogramma kaykai TaxID=54128 RepID=A0ABD2WQ16_9HYME